MDHSPIAKRKKPSRHPAVEAFINARPWLDILQSLPEPRQPVEDALLQSELSGLDTEKCAKALKAFRALAIADIRDPELLFLTYLVWTDKAYIAGKSLAEMEAISKRANLLVGPDMPLAFRWGLLYLQSRLASRRGDKMARLKMLGDGCRLFPKGDPNHARAVINKALLMAQIGRGAEAEPELAGLMDLSPWHERSVFAARFITAVEAVDLEATSRFLAEIDAYQPQTKPEESRWAGLAPYRKLAGILSSRWNPRSPSWLAGEEISADTIRWAQVSDLLLRGRAAEALAAARQEAAKGPESDLSYKAKVGWDSFDLLRAELACGNHEAARRLVVLRRDCGNVHYMDDLFLARAELLAGCREAASARMAAVTAACERYRSWGRLDLELRMSCELSPGDLARLLTTASSKLLTATSPKPVATVPVAVRGIERLVGRSPAIEQVRQQIRQFAALDVPVLITGETGTGKELVARAIHESGPRAEKPFLAVNCGAIAATLLESELFGHEKGAFTGAHRARRGLFEEAGRGTILLDEVGEMPGALQVALLRVLETSEVRPVGGSAQRRIVCRIVAATNADLSVLAEEGRFRKDLLFRLRRLEVRIPPLRERTEDVLPLADTFLSEGRSGSVRPAMSEALKGWLLAHSWPGNVRELRNAVERMRLLNSDKTDYGAGDMVLAGTNPTSGSGESDEYPPEPAPVSPSGFVSRETSAGGIAGSGQPYFRKIERLRELFRQHRELARAEVMASMGISAPTATRYLQGLCREGFIEKIRPSPSPRTHYFRLCCSS